MKLSYCGNLHDGSDDGGNSSESGEDDDDLPGRGDDDEDLPGSGDGDGDLPDSQINVLAMSRILLQLGILTTGMLLFQHLLNL